MQKLDNYIFINVTPYDFYFYWQQEVIICNFRKYGISHLMHILIWFPEEKKGEIANWEKLRTKYPEVSFFYYTDSGNTNIQLYIPQLRADALLQHFDRFPELKNKVIFYHDCDIIFNYLPDFEQLAKGEVNWESNTSSYLDYDYLSRKEKEGNVPEHEAIQKMADIGEVSIDTIKSYTGKTGGAQYILKNIDGDFWRDVKRIMMQLRTLLYHGSADSINKKYFPNENAGFQSWCADMWAVNFSLWKRGKITDVTPELNFSWATDNVETYIEKPIYHGAGATASSVGIFFKGQWMVKSPINSKELKEPMKNNASWHYWKAIQEVNNP